MGMLHSITGDVTLYHWEYYTVSVGMLHSITGNIALSQWDVTFYHWEYYTLPLGMLHSITGDVALYRWECYTLLGMLLSTTGDVTLYHWGRYTPSLGTLHSMTWDVTLHHLTWHRKASPLCTCCSAPGGTSEASHWLQHWLALFVGPCHASHYLAGNPWVHFPFCLKKQQQSNKDKNKQQ